MSSTPGTQPRPLAPVLRRPPLAEYAASLWGRRHFMLADSRARAFSGNRDMVLGNLWLVAKPLVEGALYFVIFGLILDASRGIENYPGFLLIGVFLFTYTARCATSGVGSMAASKNLLQSFSFPRAAIPLAVVIRETLSMIPVLASMVILLLVIPPHATVTWTWLLLPVVLILQLAFNAGLVLYVARLGLAIPDLKHVLTIGIRLWFYGSGVMFAIPQFVEHETALRVLQANPLYLVLSMSRGLLLDGTVPTVSSWLVLGTWALSTAMLGFVCFWQGETTYAQQ